uniref:Uncharacterized protein n=1 Tax=viral metagenome TaxID=1070528 RepID=A0A6M3KWY0_9ZZZZ
MEAVTIIINGNDYCHVKYSKVLAETLYAFAIHFKYMTTAKLWELFEIANTLLRELDPKEFEKRYRARWDKWVEGKGKYGLNRNHLEQQLFDIILSSEGMYRLPGFGVHAGSREAGRVKVTSGDSICNPELNTIYPHIHKPFVEGEWPESIKHLRPMKRRRFGRRGI